jgi:hypothetical protein
VVVNKSQQFKAPAEEILNHKSTKLKLFCARVELCPIGLHRPQFSVEFDLWEL